ncbi:Uncharacterised protein [Mycobacteroides abscessus]|jgi:hypothetical protein|nr:Uncharacterised protein [Mycobacteroides abscessus]
MTDRGTTTRYCCRIATAPTGRYYVRNRSAGGSLIPVSPSAHAAAGMNVLGITCKGNPTDLAAGAVTTGTKATSGVRR